MKVTQVAELVNSATREILGETAVLNEDLSNVVDVGKAILNSDDVDKYVRSLINHIGKVIVVNRTYRGTAPSVLMDAWQYGSILEKITIEMPEAQENESWELQDNTSYDPNIFVAPKVSAKFFNKKITFEVQTSITTKQVEQSFSNESQLTAFVSGIYGSVERSITVKNQSLIRSTINNFIAETLKDAIPSGQYSQNTTPKAVNLLKLYNDNHTGTPLTAAQAMVSPEFFRYASMIISITKNRLEEMSKLFNIGEKDRFTSSDMLHMVFLSEFVSGMKAYLQSSTYHDEYVKLPNGIEEVPFWQGSGLGYAFSDTSKIDVKIPEGDTITTSGIIGVMFDREALGVTNKDPRVTSNYNAKAEFTNYWNKVDMGLFNDYDENFVVFFVA